jgi:hypothetical protein
LKLEALESRLVEVAAAMPHMTKRTTKQVLLGHIIKLARQHPCHPPLPQAQRNPLMSTIFTGPHAHYSVDRPLLRTLGLKLEPLPHAERCVLGEVRFGNIVVVVGCSAHPARFWTFNFFVGDHLVDLWETDSGSLTTYWPQVLATVEKLKGGRR